jgi:glycine betaine/proline transport system substrate-binding protein
MKVARYTMLIGLLLAFAGMATLACASEAEPALNEAQMRSIVQEAVAKSAPAPQPQVSAEEIKSMVESAMPMAPEPVSAEEIKSMVEEAMPMAPEPVSAAEIKSMVESSMMDMASSQVSAEEIQSMVEKAVSSAAMEGASAQELQALVQSAVSAITADAITSDDVQSAISMAVMESQEGMVTSAEIQSMVENAVSSAAMEGASPQELQAMVQSAVGAITADAITAEDVQAAISMAVMESQSQEGMVTGKDVEAAVSMAVMESQKGMVTGKDVEAAVSMAVMQAQEGMVTAEDVKNILDEGAQDALTEEQVAAIVSKALEDRDMMMEMEARETVIFSDLNWTSAQVQNRIAQYIVDKGYGYPTDVVFGATLPLFNGLRNGDTDVTMEIWLPNQNEAWMEAQAAGEVVSIGESLGKDWQSAFVIPAYLQEQYPDLDSVEDLKMDKYKALFATAETGGKARLVSCVIGWACETVNASQIMGYGLDDHVHVINPGDSAASNADLYGKYEKMEPWLGYQWGTNDPPLLLDLVRLEEPAYSDECWFTTKACGYEDATILIAVRPEILSRAPDVVSMLRNWGFDLSRFKTVAAWQSDNADATVNDSALWWLNSNIDIWSDWVTDDAASAISAALMANEIPDGWPTQ